MIWLAVALCMLGSFAFAGIEAGILSVNRVRLRHHVKRGDKAAIKLDRLLAHPERLLLTVLLVTNLMNIGAVVMSTQEIVRLLGHRGYLVAIVVLLPLYLFGFELLPKSLFRRFPYRALAALSELLRVTGLILSPIVQSAVLVGHLVARKAPARRKLFAAREEFKYFAIESERLGTLSKTERELIHNVVDFRSVTAKDVMLPMEKVHSIRFDASIEEMLKLSNTTHIDRLPVASATGEIIGFLSGFEVLLEVPSDGDKLQARNTIGSYQRRIITLRADAPAESAIRQLRAVRAHLAVVVDDAGKQLGIVTSEDLIKRLVSVASGIAKPEGAAS